MTPFILIFGAFIAAVLGFGLTSAEAAFTYLPQAEADKLTADGKRRKLTRILDNHDSVMFSIRLWKVIFETLSTILLFSFLDLLIGVLWVSATVTTLVMVVVGFLMFGALPRNRGRAYPEKVVKNAHGLVYFLSLLSKPLSTFAQERAKENESEHGKDNSLTEEELREFVDRASTSEEIEDDEAQMVHSIFELDETRIRAVMVPRTDMVTIDHDETLDNALNLFMRSGYSRVPVLGDDFDDVRGFLYLKDVMEAFVAQTRGAPAQSVSDLQRSARFEPESKRVMDLLKEMQREATHVAVVVDEYGGTAGLVTLEDLIEELVGDISDEFDNEKPEIKMDGDGTFKISSRLGIEELGELFGVTIEDDDVDTVGGLLSKHLGRVPIIGSQVTVDGISIRAIGTRGRRNQIGTLLVWAEDQLAKAEIDR